MPALMRSRTKVATARIYAGFHFNRPRASNGEADWGIHSRDCNATVALTEALYTAQVSYSPHSTCDVGYVDNVFTSLIADDARVRVNRGRAKPFVYQYSPTIVIQLFTNELSRAAPVNIAN